MTKEKFCNDLFISLTSTKRKFIPIETRVIKLEKTLNYFPQMMSIVWPERKNKIGIINCGNYGNVGDYSYSFIVSNFLEGELVFIDEKNNDKEKIIDIEYLIIGGGGLFNLERLDTTNTMFKYQNYCIEYNIPYYILSVGFQDTKINTTENGKFKGYSKLLDNAQFISVRSISDYIIASSIVKEATRDFLYVYPDLVYSLAQFLPILKNERNILLVVLDDNWITLENDFIVSDINKRLSENSLLKLVFIDFAGKTKNNYKNVLNIQVIKAIFPNSKVIEGINTPFCEKRDFTLNQLIDLLCSTDTIISGRLHSDILGKVYKIPNICNYGYSNYKLDAETFSNLNVINAIEPLKLISGYIKNNIIFTSSGWDDKTRNNNIVRLHLKTGIAIKLIQNWNNRKIEEKIFEILK
jgi:exopolysaccharide biosynthesis predicted pyruvyltransferase EpsI